MNRKTISNAILALAIMGATGCGKITPTTSESSAKKDFVLTEKDICVAEAHRNTDVLSFSELKLIASCMSNKELARIFQGASTFSATIAAVCFIAPELVVTKGIATFAKISAPVLGSLSFVIENLPCDNPGELDKESKLVISKMICEKMDKKFDSKTEMCK